MNKILYNNSRRNSDVQHYELSFCKLVFFLEYSAAVLQQFAETRCCYRGEGLSLLVIGGNRLCILKKLFFEWGGGGRNTD